MAQLLTTRIHVFITKKMPRCIDLCRYIDALNKQHPANFNKPQFWDVETPQAHRQIWEFGVAGITYNYLPIIVVEKAFQLDHGDLHIDAQLGYGFDAAVEIIKKNAILEPIKEGDKDEKNPEHGHSSTNL